MRHTTKTILALGALLATAAAAHAQSLGAPAGRDAATAPGGTEGRAGPRNVDEAIHSGDAVVVTPNGTVRSGEVPPARENERR